VSAAERRIRAKLKGRIAADLWQAVWRYRTEPLGATALMIAAQLAGVTVPLALRAIIDDLGRPTRERATHAGFRAHLVKPVEMAALASEIRRLAAANA
jgi:hypothetical protein